MSVSFRRIVQATALAVPLALVSPQLPAMAADSPDPVVAEAQCDQSTVAHSAMQRCVKHAADLLAQSNKHNQGTTPAPAPAPAANNSKPAPAAPAADSKPAPVADSKPAAPAQDAPAPVAKPAPAPAPAVNSAPAQATDSPVDLITHLDAAELLDQLGITQLLLSLGIDVTALPIDLHKVLEIKGLLDSLGIYSGLEMLGVGKLISDLGVIAILDMLLPPLLAILGLGFLLKTPVPVVAAG
jgi:hypothetical protein